MWSVLLLTTHVITVVKMLSTQLRLMSPLTQALHYANDYLHAWDFPLKNFCKLAQQAETIRKYVWEKSDDAYSLSIRLQNDKPHFNLFFYHNINITKMFFQSMSWKRHCSTHWREQCSMDSYRKWQISQSDCEISSNCVLLIHVGFISISKGVLVCGQNESKYHDPAPVSLLTKR